MTNKYECRRCGKVLEINVKVTNGAVRKQHACEDCNDITSFERVDHNIRDLTDAQRHFLRESNPEIRVAVGSNSTKHIHVAHNGGTLCNNNAKTRQVSVDTYPLGYLDWCEHCLNRAHSPTKDMGQATSKEAAVKALQLADKQVEGNLTMREYNNLSITPSTTTIQSIFGTWNKAKEQSL